MKKQTIILLLFFLLLPLLSACSQDELINDATSGQILPAPESLYHDGTFKAATRYYDGSGYGQLLELLIKNGTISKVNYREINSEGSERSVIEGSESTWEELSPLTLGTLYSRLYNDFLMNQSTTGLTTISGATKTSDTFKRLSQSALNAAAENDPSLQLIETEASYTGKSRIDGKERQGVLIASYTGEKLVSLTFDEVNLQDNSLLSESNELVDGLSYADLFDAFTRINLENQNLDPIFSDEVLSPEQEKYHDCLSHLRSQRVNFNAP